LIDARADLSGVKTLSLRTKLSAFHKRSTNASSVVPQTTFHTLSSGANLVSISIARSEELNNFNWLRLLYDLNLDFNRFLERLNHDWLMNFNWFTTAGLWINTHVSYTVEIALALTLLPVNREIFVGAILDCQHTLRIFLLLLK